MCACLVRAAQANVDRNADPAEWRLEALAAKMVQYCVLLEGLTADILKQKSNVSERPPRHPSWAP